MFNWRAGHTRQGQTQEYDQATPARDVSSKRDQMHIGTANQGGKLSKD